MALNPMERLKQIAQSKIRRRTDAQLHDDAAQLAALARSAAAAGTPGAAAVFRDMRQWVRIEQRRRTCDGRLVTSKGGR